MPTLCLRKLLSAAVWVLLIVGGCSSPTDDNYGGCPHTGLNEALVPVLYWGYSFPDDGYRANEGMPVSSITQPLWYRDDAILVNSGVQVGGSWVAGIFRVNIDPQSYQFVSVEPAGFPIPIRNFDYVPSTQQLLITYGSSDPSREAALAHFEGDEIIVDSVLVDASRAPWCARADDAGRIVYYRIGSSPGFFGVGTGANGDSLLVSVVLDSRDASGFDLVLDSLYFGRTDGPSNDPHAIILQGDLAGGGQPVSFVELPGRFVSVRADGMGHVLVCTDYWGNDTIAPGGRVHVIDVASGTATRLDTRTQTVDCLTYVATFAAWSPDGHAFAFSSSAFSGEGDHWPPSLWVCKQPR